MVGGGGLDRARDHRQFPRPAASGGELSSPALGIRVPALALAGLIGIRLTRSEIKAFLNSVLYLLGMLASVAFGLFPYVLPSNTDARLSLTIYNTAPAEYGLRIGLAWWIPGMLLACAYSIFTHRKFAGKVRLNGEGY